MNEKEPPDGAKALTLGLTILRLLIQSEKAMTSTEIAQLVNVHQSTASRILRALIAEGYVRKSNYRSFVPDLGVLAMGGKVIQHFPLIKKFIEPMQAIAQDINGLSVTLATLWQGSLLYLIRCHQDQEPVLGYTIEFPLHLSSIGLKLCLDLPQNEAEKLLENSKEKYGWSRPTQNVPTTLKKCLPEIRNFLIQDILVLKDYQKSDFINMATDIGDFFDENNHPMALAIFGSASLMEQDNVHLLLQKAKKLLQNAMYPSSPLNRNVS
ncbi:MAG: hypothetical protein COA79_12320 [Planctomycetota bacterium]|nr:MAG: hypothetical protein COA79_12320 [Planctomycetota bacterium]